MIFSDKDIKQALDNGDIVIDPLPDFEAALGTCSIDLTLSPEFKVFNHSSTAYADLKNPEMTDNLMKEFIVPDGEPFIMQPGDFVLAITNEHVEIADHLIGRIEGRSSLGRLGIIVHGTASVFDAGWRGRPVMELGNLGKVPVALYPGMRICAFTFEELKSPTSIPYHMKEGRKYRNQSAPLTSKLAEEISKENS